MLVMVITLTLLVMKHSNPASKFNNPNKCNSPQILLILTYFYRSTAPFDQVVELTLITLSLNPNTLMIYLIIILILMLFVCL